MCSVLTVVALKASSSQACIIECRHRVGCQSDAIEDGTQFKLPNWFTSLSSPAHSLLAAKSTCMLRDQLLTGGTLAKHHFFNVFLEDTR